jgi:hypothetical protein
MAIDSNPVAQLAATLASTSGCILLQCDSVPQTSFNFSLPHLAVHSSSSFGLFVDPIRTSVFSHSFSVFPIGIRLCV